MYATRGTFVCQECIAGCINDLFMRLEAAEQADAADEVRDGP
jgi:hypothetical protein